MKKIIIAYDYQYDDIAGKLTVAGEVDIVCVPDYICENLEQKVQEFFDWTDTPDSGCRKEINGKAVCCGAAEDFVSWINQNYSDPEDQPALIAEKFAEYAPQYPTAEF